MNLAADYPVQDPAMSNTAKYRHKLRPCWPTWGVLKPLFEKFDAVWPATSMLLQPMLTALVFTSSSQIIDLAVVLEASTVASSGCAKPVVQTGEAPVTIEVLTDTGTALSF